MRLARLSSVALSVLPGIVLVDEPLSSTVQAGGTWQATLAIPGDTIQVPLGATITHAEVSLSALAADGSTYGIGTTSYDLG